ncbi:DUF6153 family protein [Arthrobacter koreensis]|uniref:DUF6153 family protein n=1 Tax=Arthrobacter koreensis TaxID=199136 RepID=UPI002DBDAA8B|nr:DUF6153 family protein [Arthrobacter koreensis]MEB7504131.1 DUF6153 family protein [Arthrobacter koreensis]
MRAAIRTVAARTVHVRSLPRLVIPALGLLSILAGILGMHMVAGPYPAADHTAAHASAPSAQEHSAGPSPDTGTAAPAGGHHAEGCAQCGPAGCMAGLCVLFLVLVSLAAVLGLDPLRLLRGPDNTGPPSVLPRAVAPVPTPSLDQLCISRT